LSAGQTVGTALTNLENRPIGKHTHEIGGISHTHTVPAFTYQCGYYKPESTGQFDSDNIREAHWVAAFKGQKAIVKTNTSYSGITETSVTGTGSGTSAPYVQLKACRKET
jgi:hypothetical protein